MDNAMVGANFRLANKYGLKYIITGFESTEGSKFPVIGTGLKKIRKILEI